MRRLISLIILLDKRWRIKETFQKRKGKEMAGVHEIMGTSTNIGIIF